MPIVVRIVLGACAAWCGLYELRALGLHTLPVGDVKLVHLVVMAVGAGLCLLRAVRRADERVAWALIGLALASWIGGEVYFTQVLWHDSQPPVPSWADIGYLGLPPLLFAGLVRLLGARVRALPRTLWVDGVTAALAAGALSAAVVVQAILATVGGSPLAIATNLAYPLADLVLLGVIAGALAASGWRVDRTFGLIAAAVLSFWLADSIYLVLVAKDAWVSGGPVDVGWWAAAVLLATAAWQPDRTAVPVARRATGRVVIAMPIAFACLALGVLVAGSAGHLNAVAITLATGSLAAVMLRLILTFQQHAEMLNASRREALTDPLTGLANRRHLMADLEPLEGDSGSRERVLLLFDLNGFKAYNDTFGHAAGDQLLTQLGHALDDAVSGDGRAYRLGGDEFCVLLDDAADLDALIARALTALTVDGPGFGITAAYGAARLPHEATTGSDLLKLADERMYADKTGTASLAAR